MPKQEQPRSKAVLVVGSGYGALKVANNLALSGIPTVWATKHKHFLQPDDLPATPADWPEDLSYQLRPLYLRVKQHPLVTPLPQAGLTAIDRATDGYRVTVAQAPRFIDYDRCTGCGRCLEVCPLAGSARPPLWPAPSFVPTRAPEMEKRKRPPCRSACPLGISVQGYMALTAAGRFEEALAVIRRDNPLPGVCGRVCHHPCEDLCRRGDIDQPLAIRDIKRFLFDYETQHGEAGFDLSQRVSRGLKVAVVGSGPSGLTAAHFLNREGFDVTILEALSQAGGMLRVGINAFRLPRQVLDAEIEALKKSGVVIKTNTIVRSMDMLLKQGFQAALLATGTHTDLKLGLEGESLNGVTHCVEFLSRVNMIGAVRVGRRTVVIGGGNSAMDAARTALRFGADSVTVLAIENESDLPANPEEVREAREEGVVFKLGAAPVAISGNGSVEKVVCRPAHWEFAASAPPRLSFDSDQTFDLDADGVIVAIGQRPHLDMAGLDTQIQTGPGGRITIDNRCAASAPGVFACGDAVTGPSTVVGSMAHGRQAAGRIFEYLTGQPAPFIYPQVDETGLEDWVPLTETIETKSRQSAQHRTPEDRRRDFEEINPGLSVPQAVAEAERCLQCGVCSECLACETVCTDIGAIDHSNTGHRLEFSCPAILVADQDELPANPAIPLEILYPASGARDASDLLNVMMAGTAAVGQALPSVYNLKTTAYPEKPHPVEMPETDACGFFICSCNQTMASRAALERIRELAASVNGIEVSQIVTSFCHPDGADQIAQAMHRYGLSRVIVAACVCCPLQFQCLSCNEQRNRAKINLFDRHGLDRSRFELINLRDHLDKSQSEDEIVDQARELLRSAFIRYRYLGPLRQGVTEIGQSVLILGGSKVGLSCAQNLAVQGFQIRLVHNCRLPGQEPPAEAVGRPVPIVTPPIVQVDTATIMDISGSFGSYIVTVDQNGLRGQWAASVVCLTDEHLLSLAIDTGKTGLKKFYRYDFAFFHSPEAGLYRVRPVTLNRVSPEQAGAALAAEISTAMAEAFLRDHQLSPKVDPERCRGCGRCRDICPFEAVQLHIGEQGVYTAEIQRHRCVGCGGCVGRCPVTALDMPYFSNQLLKDMVASLLAKGQ
jgi:NADPH-dependent glutamate synthase beta subunit-like oxidoreductase/Pyruvate/2-oxoacid:ferredoxin oxidoreductase delta subunit